MPRKCKRKPKVAQNKARKTFVERRNRIARYQEFLRSPKRKRPSDPYQINTREGQMVARMGLIVLRGTKATMFVPGCRK